MYFLFLQEQIKDIIINEGGEVEAILAIPALSNGRQRDEGKEEERIMINARKQAGSEC